MSIRNSRPLDPSTLAAGPNQSPEERTPDSFYLVLGIASLVMFLKLILSFYVYGTTDIDRWIHYAHIIRDHGTFEIYSLNRMYNHPPLMSWILMFVDRLSSYSGLPFQVVFRLIPIVADFAGIFLIWGLLGVQGRRHRVLICSLCALNPVNFLVSGFHGNTDPVFVFFVLLAIYFLAKDRPVVAGFAFGISLCVKIVPVLLFPAFLYLLRGPNRRLCFSLVSATVPAMVFVPYFIHDSQSMVRNVFGYRGIYGIWGLGQIIRSVIANPAVGIQVRQFFRHIELFHVSYGTPLLLIAIVLILMVISGRRALNITEGAFLTFCVFLAFTPGFGVQYLAWLSLFALMVSPLFGTIYVCAAGALIFMIYYYWGGGVPPYYANPVAVGQWVVAWGLGVWAIVVVILVAFVYGSIQRVPSPLFGVKTIDNA